MANHHHHHQHNNGRGGHGHRLETVINMPQEPEKPARFGFTGGLEFTSLTYTVVKKQRGAGGEWEKKDVDLLHEITGYAPKGCVTAVMGPSGAGKSTFLDALAGRIASLDGRVALDGVEMSPSLIKRSSAYVMQDDRLFPMLTVYETLMFAADFRLGSSVSASDKKLRVENLIEQLGLTVRKTRTHASCNYCYTLRTLLQNSKQNTNKACYRALHAVLEKHVHR